MFRAALAARPAAAPAAAAAPPFVSADAGADAGLFPHLGGVAGHAAGWGDVDGDGWADPVVGTSHKPGTRPHLLLRSPRGTLTPDPQPAVAVSAPATGALLADPDDDGGLDLDAASMPQPDRGLRGRGLLRNDGAGAFAGASDGSGAGPPAFGGRSAAALDSDGDGLPDLLVGEDPAPGRNGPPTAGSRLFRNRGGLRIEDAPKAAGLTPGVPGLGAAAGDAAGDANGDGRPDFFLSSHKGGNVLFLNAGGGTFREADRKPFARDAPAGGGNMVGGACVGDANRDGRPGPVIGQHFEARWPDPAPVRLYLSRGAAGGDPAFGDVTAAAGLVPPPMKAPHVEAQDFDNDGRPDVAVRAVAFAGGGPHPVIFKNLGVRDGVPRFRADALGVNDFPNAADRAVGRSADLFRRVLADGRVFYAAAGPPADSDNDGRLDLLLPSGWPEARPLLLRNETPGGHGPQVAVRGGTGVNRMGVGSVVRVYPAGKLGRADALLGARDVATGYGYASAPPADAHFGLGAVGAVDVEVVLPHGTGAATRAGVPADRRITVEP